MGALFDNFDWPEVIPGPVPTWHSPLRTVGHGGFMNSAELLHLLIYDFFLSKRWAGGYGLLRDFPQASRFSWEVNDRQRRKYINRGLVPMPFIRFLRDAGVHFTQPDEKLRGISAEKLGFMLLGLPPGRPQCIIRNERLESLIKHLQFTCLILRNNELRRNYRLVSTYTNIYR